MKTYKEYSESTKTQKKVAVIDFDGTICDHAFPECGEPKSGVAEALKKLQDKGYEIHILSCRTCVDLNKHPIDRREQIKTMEAYLNEHSIPYNVVLNKDKPIADVYIDDRAIGFRDNWDAIVESL